MLRFVQPPRLALETGFQDRDQEQETPAIQADDPEGEAGPAFEPPSMPLKPSKLASQFPASQFSRPRAKIHPLAPGAAPPYLILMNYILALFLPPLSILLAGRPIVAVVTFIVWIPAVIFSGGLTHPMFILLAWILIYQAREDRRARRENNN